MGTEHEANRARTQPITAQTCLQCRTQAQDPRFDFAKSLARIAHSNSSGETLRGMTGKRGAGMK